MGFTLPHLDLLYLHEPSVLVVPEIEVLQLEELAFTQPTQISDLIVSQIELPEFPHLLADHFPESPDLSQVVIAEVDDLDGLEAGEGESFDGDDAVMA